MEEFLKEAGIATDSLTGRIALFLDGQRRRNRSRYARTITAIGTVIVARKGLEIMQVQLAMNGAVPSVSLRLRIMRRSKLHGAMPPT